MDQLSFSTLQSNEYEAWRAVTSELRRLGIGINSSDVGECLHDAITAWAEELAQLRMNDPDPTHAVNALAQRRAKYLDTEYFDTEEES